MTNAAIKKATLAYNFETAAVEKNILTDAELEVFWKTLQKQTTGVDNWKQHYLSWNLMYLTAARPGSFTVGYGYEKGSLRATNIKREDDETLRFKDLTFWRTDSGDIACKVVFRFNKGQRDVHSQRLVGGGRREFNILPLTSNRYHLDVALMLLAWAFQRGLFTEHQSLDSLFSGTEKYIQKDPSVEQEAVFLAADNSGNVVTSKPMHERSLNPKLQSMCTLAGLYRYNSCYGFRRAAIISTRRKHGTERARSLAGHSVGAETITVYDVWETADVDVANDRYDTEEMSREKIRAHFAQSKDATWLPGAQGMDTFEHLQQYLNQESRKRARSHADYVACDVAIDEAYHDASQLLIQSGVDINYLATRTRIEARLRDAQSDDGKSTSALQRINDARKEQEKTFRRLLRSMQKSVKHELREETERAVKITPNLGRRGNMSVIEAQTLASSSSSHEPSVDERMAQIEQLEDSPLSEEGQTDEEGDEQHENGDAEPEQWKDLAEEVTIETSQGPFPRFTVAGRLNFAKTFAGSKVRSAMLPTVDVVHRESS